MFLDVLPLTSLKERRNIASTALAYFCTPIVNDCNLIESVTEHSPSVDVFHGSYSCHFKILVLNCHYIHSKIQNLKKNKNTMDETFLWSETGM